MVPTCNLRFARLMAAKKGRWQLVINRQSAVLFAVTRRVQVDAWTLHPSQIWSLPLCRRKHYASNGLGNLGLIH